jgi:hypothetical protein
LMKSGVGVEKVAFANVFSAVGLRGRVFLFRSAKWRLAESTLSVG